MFLTLCRPHLAAPHTSLMPNLSSASPAFMLLAEACTDPSPVCHLFWGHFHLTSLSFPVQQRVWPTAVGPSTHPEASAAQGACTSGVLGSSQTRMFSLPAQGSGSQSIHSRNDRSTSCLSRRPGSTCQAFLCEHGDREGLRGQGIPEGAALAPVPKAMKQGAVLHPAWRPQGASLLSSSGFSQVQGRSCWAGPEAQAAEVGRTCLFKALSQH